MPTPEERIRATTQAPNTKENPNIENEEENISGRLEINIGGEEDDDEQEDADAGVVPGVTSFDM